VNKPPRRQLTAAILPILAGTAAAMVVGNVPQASSTPLGASLGATWVVISCPAGAPVSGGAFTPRMVARSPRELDGPVRALP
jgi:hypothetical protein